MKIIKKSYGKLLMAVFLAASLPWITSCFDPRTGFVKGVVPQTSPIDRGVYSYDLYDAEKYGKMAFFFYHEVEPSTFTIEGNVYVVKWNPDGTLDESVGASDLFSGYDFSNDNKRVTLTFDPQYTFTPGDKYDISIKDYFAYDKDDQGNPILVLAPGSGLTRFMNVKEDEPPVPPYITRHSPPSIVEFPSCVQKPGDPEPPPAWPNCSPLFPPHGMIKLEWTKPFGWASIVFTGNNLPRFNEPKNKYGVPFDHTIHKSMWIDSDEGLPIASPVGYYMTSDPQMSSDTYDPDGLSSLLNDPDGVPALESSVQFRAAQDLNGVPLAVTHNEQNLVGSEEDGEIFYEEYKGPEDGILTADFDIQTITARIKINTPGHNTAYHEEDYPDVVSGICISNSGVYDVLEIQVELDGVIQNPTVSCTPDPGGGPIGTFTFPLLLGIEDQGQHTIKARIKRDGRSGNEDLNFPEFDVIGVTIDDIALPPVLTGIPAYTNDDQITVTITGEPYALVDIKQDSLTIIDDLQLPYNGVITQTTDISSLTDGNYAFEAMQVDPLGNVSAWSTPIPMVVDRTLPVITQVSPADGDHVSGPQTVDVNVQVTIDDPNMGSVTIAGQVATYNAGLGVYEATLTYTLAPGEYSREQTYSVIVEDLAGNSIEESYSVILVREGPTNLCSGTADQTISSSITFYEENSPINVSCNLYVNNATILSEEGVEWRVSDTKWIKVRNSGKFNTNGIDGNEVLITRTASSGYWGGITYESTANPSTLKYATVTYGKTPLGWANVSIKANGIRIENSYIHNGHTRGVWVGSGSQGNDAIIISSDLRDNGPDDGTGRPYSVAVENYAGLYPTLDDCDVNEIAVTATSTGSTNAGIDVKNTRFWWGGAGYVISASIDSLVDFVVARGNIVKYDSTAPARLVRIWGSSLSSSGTLQKICVDNIMDPCEEVKYQVWGDISVGSSTADMTLSIDRGVQMYFRPDEYSYGEYHDINNPAGIFVSNGEHINIGTVSNPADTVPGTVTMTRFSTGYWDGLDLDGAGSVTIRNLDIRYGSIPSPTYYSNIWVKAYGEVIIEDSDIQYAEGRGIVFDKQIGAPDPVIKNSNLLNNGYYSIAVRNASGLNPLVQNCDLDKLTVWGTPDTPTTLGAVTLKDNRFWYNGTGWTLNAPTRSVLNFNTDGNKIMQAHSDGAWIYLLKGYTSEDYPFPGGALEKICVDDGNPATCNKVKYLVLGDIYSANVPSTYTPPNPTLSIEAGVEMYFKPGAGITVKNGDNLIIGDVAGDTVLMTREGDMSGTGYWGGMNLEGVGSVSINSLKIRYGSTSAHDFHANIQLDHQVSASIVNSEIQFGEHRGLVIWGIYKPASRAEIIDSDIRKNGWESISVSNSSYFKPLVRGCDLEKVIVWGSSGHSHTNGAIDLQGNTFWWNDWSWLIWAPTKSMLNFKAKGNVINKYASSTSSQRDIIRLSNAPVPFPTGTIEKICFDGSSPCDKVTYRVIGDIYLVNTGVNSTLTIDPGVEMYFRTTLADPENPDSDPRAGVRVGNGDNLIIAGAEAEPVVMTKLGSDYWEGMDLNGAGSVDIDYLEISYGNTESYGANIRLNPQISAEIRNSKVLNGDRGISISGKYAAASQPEIINSEVRNQVEYSIYVKNASGLNPLIKDSDVNRVLVDGAPSTPGAVDLRGNTFWWSDNMTWILIAPLQSVVDFRTKGIDGIDGNKVRKVDGVTAVPGKIIWLTAGNYQYPSGTLEKVCVEYTSPCEKVNYRVRGNLFLHNGINDSPVNPTLNIEAGVEMYFETSAGIKVADNDNLTIAGTEAEPVIMTRLWSSDYWEGMDLNGAGSVDIDYLDIRYGNTESYGANIVLKPWIEAIIDNSIIKNGFRGVVIPGRYAGASDPEILNSEIRDNQYYSIAVAGNNLGLRARVDLCDLDKLILWTRDDGSGNTDGQLILTNNRFFGSGEILRAPAKNILFFESDGNVISSAQSVSMTILGAAIGLSSYNPGFIREDATLRNLPKVSHYEVRGNMIISALNESVLTIEPGVQVEFDAQAELNVGTLEKTNKLGASLIMDGSEVNPIILIPKLEGVEWKGIKLNDKTDRSILDYVVINGGGGILSPYCAGCNNLTLIEEGGITITNSVFMNPPGNGANLRAYVTPVDLKVMNSHFLSSYTARVGIILERKGKPADSEYSEPVIERNIIEDGIRVWPSSNCNTETERVCDQFVYPVLIANQFINIESGTIIHLPLRTFKEYFTSFTSSNVLDGIFTGAYFYLTGGVTGPGDFRFPDLGIKNYRITHNDLYIVSHNPKDTVDTVMGEGGISSLIIDPGVRIEFPPARGIQNFIMSSKTGVERGYTEGVLKAKGTFDKPIILSNQGGNNWAGVSLMGVSVPGLQPLVPSELEFVRIENAGAYNKWFKSIDDDPYPAKNPGLPPDFEVKGAIILRGTNSILSSSVITGSESRGIYLQRCITGIINYQQPWCNLPTIKYNKFESNDGLSIEYIENYLIPEPDYKVTDPPYPLPLSPAPTKTPMFDASLNWWGSDNGATLGGVNGISVNVDSDPWLADDPYNPIYYNDQNYQGYRGYDFTNASIKPEVFSPSNTVPAYTEITGSTNNDMIHIYNVKDLSGNIIDSTTPSSPTQSFTMAWSGLDGSSNPYPYGTYLTNLSATTPDGLHKSVPLRGTIVLDSAAPLAQITLPQDGDLLDIGQSSHAIEGIATTADGVGEFLEFNLEWAYPWDSSQWYGIVNNNENAQPGGLLGNWDITDLTEGNYLIRLRSKNIAGHEISDVIEVELGHPIKIVNVETSTDALNTADNDTVDISFMVEDDAGSSANVEIELKLSPTYTDRIINVGEVPTNTQLPPVTWDGMDGSSPPVLVTENNAYEFIITAVDAADSSRTATFDPPDINSPMGLDGVEIGGFVKGNDLYGEVKYETIFRGRVSIFYVPLEANTGSIGTATPISTKYRGKGHFSDQVIITDAQVPTELELQQVQENKDPSLYKTYLELGPATACGCVGVVVSDNWCGLHPDPVISNSCKQALYRQNSTCGGSTTKVINDGQNRRECTIHPPPLKVTTSGTGEYKNEPISCPPNSSTELAVNPWTSILYVVASTVPMNSIIVDNSLNTGDPQAQRKKFAPAFGEVSNHSLKTDIPHNLLTIRALTQVGTPLFQSQVCADVSGTYDLYWDGTTTNSNKIVTIVEKQESYGIEFDITPVVNCLTDQTPISSTITKFNTVKVK